MLIKDAARTVKAPTPVPNEFEFSLMPDEAGKIILVFTSASHTHSEHHPHTLENKFPYEKPLA